MFILNYLSIYWGFPHLKHPFYSGKFFKKLNIWVFTKYFNIAKYISYLEKNSIRSLVWSKLFWSSNSRLFWFKVLVNVLNSVTTPVIFVLTLMLRSTEISIFTIQTPGNGILMPNTEKSVDALLGKFMRIKSQWPHFFFQIHLPNFPQSLSEFSNSCENIYSLSDLFLQK